jgi:hypothetical protein
MNYRIVDTRFILKGKSFNGRTWMQSYFKGKKWAIKEVR